MISMDKETQLEFACHYMNLQTKECTRRNCKFGERICCFYCSHRTEEPPFCKEMCEIARFYLIGRMKMKEEEKKEEEEKEEEQKVSKARIEEGGEYITVIKKGEDNQHYIAIYKIFVESTEGFESQEEAEKVANELVSKLKDSF